MSYPVLFAEFTKSPDTLRVFHGGKLTFTSTEGRLLPFLKYLEEFPRPKPGAVVFDRITGNAAALLDIRIKAKAVFSELGSELAGDTLARAGIKYVFNRTVPRITKPCGTEICPMEQASLGKTSDEFYRYLRSDVS